MTLADLRGTGTGIVVPGADQSRNLDLPMA